MIVFYHTLFVLVTIRTLRWHTRVSRLLMSRLVILTRTGTGPIVSNTICLLSLSITIKWSLRDNFLENHSKVRSMSDQYVTISVRQWNFTETYSDIIDTTNSKLKSLTGKNKLLWSVNVVSLRLIDFPWILWIKNVISW